MKNEGPKSLVPWKIYLRVTAETITAFFVATFCLLMFIAHRPSNWVLPMILIAITYLFVIGICIRRVFQKLPLSAIMLIIPIAPLLALIMVVSLIPVIQYLQF